jgi:hypothetical protein
MRYVHGENAICLILTEFSWRVHLVPMATNGYVMDSGWLSMSGKNGGRRGKCTGCR